MMPASLLVNNQTIVDRADELGEALARMRSLFAGSHVRKCVIVFHGVSQIGKSALLAELHRRAIEQGIHTVRIDFRHLLGHESAETRDVFDIQVDGPIVAGMVMEQLAKAADLVPGQPIWPTSSVDEALDSLLDFASYIYVTREQRPFAFFLDTVEGDLPAFAWIQSRILKSFLETFPVFIAVASRVHPEMQSYEPEHALARRTQMLRLTPFDAKTSAHQLEVLGVTVQEELVQRILDNTGGLPGLNRATADWLTQRGTSRLTGGEVSDIDSGSLLIHLVRQRILGPSGYDVDRAYLDEVLAVSALRRFDSDLLRQLMIRLGKEQYEDNDQLRSLVAHMMNTCLLEKHPTGAGYVIAPVLRLILDRYTRMVMPEVSLQVQQFAAQWCEKMVQTGDYAAIVDRIYYLMGTGKILRQHPHLVYSGMLVMDKPDIPQQLYAEMRKTLDLLRDEGVRVDETTQEIREAVQGEEFTALADESTIRNLAQICSDS